MPARIPPIQPPLPDEEWVLASRAMEFASETRGDSTLMATMTCYEDDGGLEIYCFPDFNEEIKMAAMHIVRMKKRWTSCMFVSEAWVSNMRLKDLNGRIIPPSKDPNRRDALIAILYSSTYRIMWSLLIKNNVVGDTWELSGDERTGWHLTGKLSA